MTQDLIKTSKDKEEFRKCIELLKASIFKSNDSEEILKNKIPLKFADFFSNLIKGRLDTKDMENAFTKLENHLNRLKEVNLVIAFDPTRENIDKIYDWINKNLGENIIINLRVEKDIIGGAIITYGGYYEDLSLKKFIEKGFLEKKGDILKLIK